ncbi:hypothetical protein KP509_29G001600 [Ceratopteris richardii]|nr:hypothetical protein KP509_29G001600 [Ceratopteris richardii]
MRILWKVSNRNYRRWMNDRLLRELAPPLDAQEIGSLFAPPPWGEKSVQSPFARVIACGEDFENDKVAWEPFRNNVDMDMEARVLQQSTRESNKVICKEGQKHKAALRAWQGVSHKYRDILRRRSSWHLISLFEEKIISFLEEVVSGRSEYLYFNVEDAYHRLLIHGLCEFHGLVSKTISNIESDGSIGCANLMIKPKGKNRIIQEPYQGVPMPLLHFLVGADKGAPLAASGA